MRDPSSPKQRSLLGADEAASMAEALLSTRQTSVTELLESFDAESEDADDRRDDVDFNEVIRNSVFGKPEPQGRSRTASVTTALVEPTTAGRPSPLTIGATRTIVRPEPAVRAAAGAGMGVTSGSGLTVASIARSGAEDNERRRKITFVLASLFAIALVASAGVTILGDGSTVEAETQPEPTVAGTTQTAPSTSTSAPATTLAETTVPAPPTTPIPTTAAPTTAAPTTTTAAPTTAAPTTAAPTTAAPTTRRPATTRAPATTQRPATTAAPTTAAPVTTQITIPDVTFSQPTWVPTDPEPAPVDP